MIIRLYIFFILLVISHVVVPMAAGQNADTNVARQASDNPEPKEFENSVEPDSISYSANTHERYQDRFLGVSAEPDSSDQWNELLGVEKWGSVDLYKNVRDDIHVFGWHPFWAEDAVKMYDYELLTMVSYFGYEFNHEDGTEKNAHRWSDTELHTISKEVKSPVNIFLTVFSYDGEENNEFLADDEAMIQLVDDVDALLEKKEAKGVTVDIQNFSAKNSGQYLRLLKRFSEILKPKDREIIAVIPAVDPDSAYLVNQMAEYFDYLIVTGYDFHGQGKEMGPFSVLYETETWDYWSIEKRVTDLMADEPAFEPQQVLISLGWIGSLYEETGSGIQHLEYRSVGFMNKTFHGTDTTAISFGNVKIQEDKASRTNFIEYQNEDNSNWRTYYFTDTTSFTFNLDWIEKQELGGVAIWTLADAGNIKGYWNAIAETYGRPPPSIMTNVLIPLWEFIVDEWLHPYLSLFLSIIIVFLFLVALIYISYKRSVPEWLRKLGVFLPFIIFLLMLFSLLHDLLAHLVVDQWDDPVKTTLSLVFGSLLLLIALWYCVRVYYFDRKSVP